MRGAILQVETLYISESCNTVGCSDVRRIMKKIILLAVVCAVAGGAAFFYTHRDHRPNVIILLLDTLRADHLGVYGYERATTPVLDQFAKENIRAQWAFTAAPWTPPSVAAILSGLYVTQHGLMPPNGREQAKEATAKLKPDVEVLGEVLQRSGYITTGISSNPWITKAFGFDQGFDTFVSIPRARGGEVTLAGIKAVKEMAGSAKPFFLYLHYLDPHTPYDPPEGYRDIYKEPVKNPIYTESAQEKLSLYDGEIKYLDTAVGKFLEYLKTEKLYEDSIIVILGDHGEQFGEHGEFGHGFQLYNEELRVPILFRAGTKTEPGKVLDTTVSTVDVFPTILKLLGIPVSPGHLGISFLDPEAQAKRAGVFSEIRRIHNEKSFTSYDGRAIIVGSLESTDNAASDDPGKNVLALLDRHDPKNAENTQPAVEAKEELQMEFRSLLHEMQANKVTGAGKAGDVPDATLDQLKSLGYLQ
jgi:arylsulfatase A-like enzyme